jgi:hypothetical protein
MNLIEAVTVLLLAFFLCQDIYPTEALAISQRTYKTIKDPIKGSLNWKPYADFHQDYKNSALFVKQKMDSNDKIMVLGAPYVAPIILHYIGKVNYVIIEDIGWYGIPTEAGIVHYITGSIAIPDFHSFEQVVENNGNRFWVLSDYYLRDHYYPPAMRRTINRLTKNRVFIGEDDKTFVYLIDSKVTTPIKKGR